MGNLDDNLGGVSSCQSGVKVEIQFPDEFKITGLARWYDKYISFICRGTTNHIRIFKMEIPTEFLEERDKYNYRLINGDDGKRICIKKTEIISRRSKEYKQADRELREAGLVGI